MGLIGVVSTVEEVVKPGEEAAEVTEITLDPGSNTPIEADNYSAPNIDSKPLPGDYVVTVATPDGQVTVGFVDPKNTDKAVAGEFRVTARDSEGVVKCSVHLKSDGAIRAENDEGFFELQADGVFNINDHTTVDP